MELMKNGHTIRTMDDWLSFAPPKKGLAHWAEGRSAYECARAWCAAAEGPSVPAELTALLGSHPDIAGVVVQTVMPEHRVRFDKLRGEPRNADVAVLGDHPAGSIAISIEAKADEPFDRLVDDVLLDVARKIGEDHRTNRITRIQQLAASLLPPTVPGSCRLGLLRYQLLTALAGALAFAIDAKAGRAVLVVHELVTDRTNDAKQAANAGDLHAFITRLTAGAETCVPAGRLVGPVRVPGFPLFPSPPPLYIGKAVRVVRKASSDAK
jgi:hypothetical protein